MNKAELVAAMAEKTELSKKDAEAALKAFTDVVAEEMYFAESKKEGSDGRSEPTDENGFMNIPEGIDEELPFN